MNTQQNIGEMFSFVENYCSLVYALREEKRGRSGGAKVSCILCHQGSN